MKDFAEDTHNVNFDKDNFRVHCYTYPRDKLIDFEGWKVKIQTIEGSEHYVSEEIYPTARVAAMQALLRIHEYPENFLPF